MKVKHSVAIRVISSSEDLQFVSTRRVLHCLLKFEKLRKILAWNLTNVKNKTEVIAEARKEGKTVHFASLMDLCHLKNSELEPRFQK